MLQIFHQINYLQPSLQNYADSESYQPHKLISFHLETFLIFIIATLVYDDESVSC